MKFTVYHTRYGYYGLDNGVPVYMDNDMSDAALFTNESAKELLVDIFDPQVVITTLTDAQIKALPFKLIDTDDYIKQQAEKLEYEAQNAQIMTANTFQHVEDIIDNLNHIDTANIGHLNCEDLEVASLLN